MWLLFQYSASKFHLLIQQIREGVAIVSEQFINYIHSLVNLKDNGGCGYCFSSVYKLTY